MMKRRQKLVDPDQQLKRTTVVARLRTQREARRVKVLQAWKAEQEMLKRHFEEMGHQFAPLSDEALREFCLMVLANPDLLIDDPPSLIDDPDYSRTPIPLGGKTNLRPYAVYRLMQAFVAKMGRPGPLTQQQIADLVDHLIDETGVTLTEARHLVAHQLKKTNIAVERTHQRFGRRKGRQIG
jgi:hypothetical protein